MQICLKAVSYIRGTKFGQAHLNDEQKVRLLLILPFEGISDLIWVASSAENINLAKKIPK